MQLWYENWSWRRKIWIKIIFTSFKNCFCTTYCPSCWDWINLNKGDRKSSKLHPEGWVKAEHFCYGNILPLLIKLEKFFQVFSQFLCRWGPYNRGCINDFPTIQRVSTYTEDKLKQWFRYYTRCQQLVVCNIWLLFFTLGSLILFSYLQITEPVLRVRLTNVLM